MRRKRAGVLFALKLVLQVSLAVWAVKSFSHVWLKVTTLINQKTTRRIKGIFKTFILLRFTSGVCVHSLSASVEDGRAHSVCHS